MTLPHLFRSLHHRNYRIYFVGQLLSLVGTWMQATAQSWLVYRLTSSGTLLGLTATFTLLPSLLFGMYGGWLADKFPRRSLLILVHTLAMLQALVLAILTLGHWIEAWHVLLLAFFLGMVQAIETPVRQSFILQLVNREDLANAIALSSSTFHVARFIGPAVAGVMVALTGEGPVFLLNACSFLAILMSLYRLQLSNASVSQQDDSGLNTLWSGFHYAREHDLIRILLFMVAATGFFGGSAVVLLPIFVVDIFNHGPDSLGLLMGMLGTGSLIAALTLANSRELNELEWRVAISGTLVGFGLLFFSVITIYWIAFLFLILIGFASTTVFATSNTLIQLAVPDHLRGRVMALFAMCLHGTVSIGQLVLGSLADVFSAPIVACADSLLLLLVTFWIAKHLLRTKNMQ